MCPKGVRLIGNVSAPARAPRALSWRISGRTLFYFTSHISGPFFSTIVYAYSYLIYRCHITRGSLIPRWSMARFTIVSTVTAGVSYKRNYSFKLPHFLSTILSTELISYRGSVIFSSNILSLNIFIIAIRLKLFIKYYALITIYISDASIIVYNLRLLKVSIRTVRRDASTLLLLYAQ